MIFENLSPKDFFCLNMKNFEISVLTEIFLNKSILRNLDTTFSFEDGQLTHIIKFSTSDNAFLTF